jgi:hypothetical protein
MDGVPGTIFGSRNIIITVPLRVCDVVMFDSLGLRC